MTTIHWGEREKRGEANEWEGEKNVKKVRDKIEETG